MELKSSPALAGRSWKDSTWFSMYGFFSPVSKDAFYREKRLCHSLVLGVLWTRESGYNQSELSRTHCAINRHLWDYIYIAYFITIVPSLQICNNSYVIYSWTEKKLSFFFLLCYSSPRLSTFLTDNKHKFSSLNKGDDVIYMHTNITCDK